MGGVSPVSGGAQSDLLISAEEERDAPHGRNSHKNVNSSCDKAAGAAEEPGDEVEFKDTDQTPVYSAHDEQNKSDLVPHRVSYLSERIRRLKVKESV